MSHNSYNIYIRPLREEDAKTSFRWRNDPEVWHFTGSRPDCEITYEIELEWIRKVLTQENSHRFAIIADEEYIGNIQLTNIADERAEYHIFIGDKNWWGKGVSYLATKQLLQFAKDQLSISEIYLQVRKDNLAAVRSYLKSGFVQSSQSNEWLTMNFELDNFGN